MQQSVSPVVRQNIFKGKREQKYRSIRAQGTGTSQVHTNNSFLKECFTDIPLTEFTPLAEFKEIASPQMNMEKLIKAASGYLALYGKELSFTPSGKFGRDMTDLLHAVTSLLPDNQSLNVDYIDKEFVFIVYQSHPKKCWGTIIYLPVSIVHTMRPKIRKLFIRFMAFIVQQNNLPSIKDTYDYEYYEEYIQNRIDDKSEEVDESYIETMRSYKNKRGKANQMLLRIVQCKDCRPNELLAELKSLKGISLDELEQVQCMVRGLELLSRDRLSTYAYADNYDELSCEYTEDTDRVYWYDLICVSWGTSSDDPLIDFHFESLCERCNYSEMTEPFSSAVLSPDKSEKLPPCTFPFDWMDYICNDFYKYLAINE